MAKHVFLVRNTFLGTTGTDRRPDQVRYRILEVPAEHASDPDSWYLREIDHTSHLLDSFKYENWGGAWVKATDGKPDVEIHLVNGEIQRKDMSSQAQNALLGALSFLGQLEGLGAPMEKVKQDRIAEIRAALDSGH